jgi:A/G-specific adenine glycosylase
VQRYRATVVTPRETARRRAGAAAPAEPPTTRRRSADRQPPGEPARQAARQGGTRQAAPAAAHTALGIDGALEPRVVRRFGRLLRAWYRVNCRDLPWRRTRDPYHILVSELMLQQTQVARVVPRYHEFLDRYPSLAHVARDAPDRVLEAWAGLGYYARARNLHRLACQVTSDGRDTMATLPAEPDELRALPGIGAYTAGAVSSFAYERRAPLVDTNVARVLRRVFAPSLHEKSGATTRALWSIARATLPRAGRESWTHNQALMELGALVCTARVRRCEQCPVRRVCATNAEEGCGSEELAGSG